MSLFVVLLVAALVIALLVFPPRKRSQVDQLIREIDRSEDEEELAAAEDEVRSLDAMSSPEDAAEHLPDWGPGAPRKKRRD
jgi:hypothetical protein